MDPLKSILSGIESVTDAIRDQLTARIQGDEETDQEQLRRLVESGVARERPEPPPGAKDPEVERLVGAYRAEVSRKNWWEIKPGEFPTGAAILAADPALRIAVLKEIHRRFPKNGWSENSGRLDSLSTALLAKELPFDAREMVWLVDAAVHDQRHRPSVVRQVRQYRDRGGDVTPELLARLRKLRQEVAKWMTDAASRKLVGQIDELLGISDRSLPDPGEPWSDRALADVGELPADQQGAWVALFDHATTAESGSSPSAKWLKEADKRIRAVGEAEFDACAARWLGLVALPARVPDAVRERNERWAAGDHDYDDEAWNTKPGISEKNVTLLKGLAWACATRPDPQVARALAKTAEACLRKIPGIGPWAQRASSAAVQALSMMPCDEGAAHLGRLKTRVAYRPMFKVIEKALEAAAKRAGMTKQDLEDLAVPTLGFDTDGTRREKFGDYAATATLAPDGSVNVAWEGPGGKALKSVPAEVKREHAEDWKAFKSDADAAEKLATAQRYRLESFYLDERTWRLSDWRTRFADHPLLGPLARRVIWHFADGEGLKAEGLWDDERRTFADAEGKALDWLADETTVSLWHPLGFPIETVMSWRETLEARRVRQPFKQAHREVYLLTDAELNTGTYSNRFAGHVLKQHQFNALASQRGWQYRLGGGWDGGWSEAARIFLPHWNLRAEFFTDPAGDTFSDAGIYTYVATDQVRFYRQDGEQPLPLTEVPALVFSEIMRDVDLFVGVCSVGNDPAWRDTGPEGFRGYWQDYSFGDLSASAKTRSEVLARLLPRLKIASRAHLDGKFLVVRGDLRTYKIHLGSGNILMEPNDQYLCIVQDRKQDSQKDTGDLFLPFEGDQRLALILSKAFLLAEDTKIKDTTITSQIKARY